MKNLTYFLTFQISSIFLFAFGLGMRVESRLLELWYNFGYYDIALMSIGVLLIIPAIANYRKYKRWLNSQIDLKSVEEIKGK